MKKILCILLVVQSLLCAAKTGYISYSTSNIGDDIQTLAAKRFLPDEAVPIDREYIGVYESPEEVHAIVNGWYMHTKDLYWYLNPYVAPEKSWPPSKEIHPLLIGIHFTPPFVPYALTEEGIAYLTEHGPVGARDLKTLETLQHAGIPSYFSGCLTLTLQNPYGDGDREEIIYAVDVSDRVYNYIRRHTRAKVIRINHGVPEEIMFNNEARLTYAESLLEKYRKAKAVVTGRLHATLPCVAFDTPVLRVGQLDSRFGGLNKFFAHCSERDLLRGKVSFDFDNPPKNSGKHHPLRTQTIETVEEWVRNHS